jgi:uncharacterized protein YfbU (UPF0304 family)
MFFKKLFKEIRSAREDATINYKRITDSMTDKILYKQSLDIVFIDKIYDEYCDCLIRIIRCYVKVQRSFSKKKIKNAIDAMNIIYDGFMNRVNYMIQETITVY